VDLGECGGCCRDLGDGHQIACCAYWPNHCVAAIAEHLKYQAEIYLQSILWDFLDIFPLQARNLESADLSNYYAPVHPLAQREVF
jgi:hypothetical protein